MKHRPRPEEQDDLLRPRLIDMLDGRHELVRLFIPHKGGLKPVTVFLNVPLLRDPR